MMTLRLAVVLVYVIAIGAAEKEKQKRKALVGDFSGGFGLKTTIWSGSHVPLQQTDLYTQGVTKFLPPPRYDSLNLSPLDITLKGGTGITLKGGTLPAPLPPVQGNSVEKPVDEPQEYVPPQRIGSAVIPLLPPPATPVNAAASNVPTNMGAVFLGSGSLGVVNLGNGAYALGSGSLGYSEIRAQPRPSDKVPVYPPLPASPNLIPAAVSSQQQPAPQPPQIPFTTPQPSPLYPTTTTYFPGFPSFIPSILGPQYQPSSQRNQYEPLPPDRIRFGDPSLIPRRLKITMSFATPTVEQPSLAYPNPPQNFGPNTPDINANRRPPQPAQQPLFNPQHSFQQQFQEFQQRYDRLQSLIH